VAVELPPVAAAAAADEGVTPVVAAASETAQHFAAVHPPVAAAAAADEGVTPVVAAASETAQRFAAGHVAAVHVAAVHVAAVHVAAVHAAALQTSAPAVVAAENAVALAVGATAAADTASGLAQLHQGRFDWEALQAAAHQKGSAAMDIAAEHTLQPAQGVLPGQRKGLEGGRTGTEQGLPVDGRKMAGRFGEQGGLRGMKGGSGRPAYETVQDKGELDLAELAQKIETDSCKYAKHQSCMLSKDQMA